MSDIDNKIAFYTRGYNKPPYLKVMQAQVYVMHTVIPKQPLTVQPPCTPSKHIII